MKVLEALVQSIRTAAVYNPDSEAPPACILWPDHDRQWESVITELQATMPELLVLGDYAPEQRRGPAIWLRCVIANKIDGVSTPEMLASPPILYLPGVSRQDLRPTEHCPVHLQPLAELQYRGVVWLQDNHKDWSVLAWLKSTRRGLKLDVAQDQAAKQALDNALSRLLEEELDLLRDKHLDQNYFNTLLTGGDPVRDLLLWLDQGEDFRKHRSQEEWQAFAAVCQAQYGYHPGQKGVLDGAARLAEHTGPWQVVWERYCEAPARYPHIPAQINRCTPPEFDLFPTETLVEGWPQWNDAQEQELLDELSRLTNLPPHQASEKILNLEKIHAFRRQLVWQQLGRTPLAEVLGYLSEMVNFAQFTLTSASTEELAQRYQQFGWKVDSAVLQAMAVELPEQQRSVVADVLRLVYTPWLEDAARNLQRIWPDQAECHPLQAEQSDRCVVFVDGLRFDCGKQLAELLCERGLEVIERTCWAALPSVTGTSKPAVAPIAHDSVEVGAAVDAKLEALTTHQFRKALDAQGFRVADSAADAVCDDLLEGKCWLEYGNLDHEGHLTKGWKLANRIPALLNELADQITELLQQGWPSVRVVTDHGWLLLPGGLPKTELPCAQTMHKWGRCAVLKQGARTDEQAYPWFWDNEQLVALADGISCYREGCEFAHGGLSLQECLTPQLEVRRGMEQQRSELKIVNIEWRGLRCYVELNGGGSDCLVDLRIRAGDPGSSVVANSKRLDDNQRASVVVEDEDLEGNAAFVVVVNQHGELLAQQPTGIGG